MDHWRRSSHDVYKGSSIGHLHLEGGAARVIDRKPGVGGGGDVSLGELVLHSLTEPR